MNETLMTIKLVNNNVVIEVDKTAYEDKVKLDLLSICLNRQRKIVDDALIKLIKSEYGIAYIDREHDIYKEARST